MPYGTQQSTLNSRTKKKLFGYLAGSAVSNLKPHQNCERRNLIKETKRRQRRLPNVWHMDELRSNGNHIIWHLYGVNEKKDENDKKAHTKKRTHTHLKYIYYFNEAEYNTRYGYICHVIHQQISSRCE